jgi:preprotein translocase subunit SecF
MFSVETLKNIAKISIIYTVFFLLIIIFHGLKLSQEIKGGTFIQFSSSENYSKIKEKLPKVQVNSQQRYTVELDSKLETKIEQIKTTIKEIGTIESIQVIGPSISKYMIKSLITACLAAFLGVFMYVFIRFDLKFSIAGMYAILHDVIACFFVTAVFNLELSLMVIVGVLTTIGYSINNTIVVYYKIREGLNPDSKTSVDNTITLSIQKVFKRSMLTSLSTLCAAICIFLFPDKSIQNFAIITITGIVFGTFSSLFLSTGILGIAKINKPKKKKPLSYMHYAS